MACGTPTYRANGSQPAPYDLDLETLVADAAGEWSLHLQGATTSYDLVLNLAPVAGDESGPYGPSGIAFGALSEVPCTTTPNDDCFGVGIPMTVTLSPYEGRATYAPLSLRFEGTSLSAEEDVGRGHVPLTVQMGGTSYACDVVLTESGVASGSCIGAETLVVSGARQ